MRAAHPPQIAHLLSIRGCGIEAGSIRWRAAHSARTIALITAIFIKQSTVRAAHASQVAHLLSISGGGIEAGSIRWRAAHATRTLALITAFCIK